MDTLFWILSKLLWELVSPVNVALILLFVGMIFIWSRRQRLGIWLLSMGALMFLIFSVFPINVILLKPLEERFPVPQQLPENISGIIALGGSEKSVIALKRGQPSVNEAAERLITFVTLAMRYPQAQLIYASGPGALTQQNYDPTDTARQLFEQLGLNLNRVRFDSKSRNTVENAVNSFKLLGQKAEGNWVIISSAYHMPRVVGIFRKIGWKIIPYPVDYQTSGEWKHDWEFAKLHNFMEFSKGLHEWLGLLVYWMTGKTSELFPKPA